jgi:hypothetical protein
MGDFNIDFNDQDNETQMIINEMNRTMGLRPLLLNEPTHDAGRQLDWILSNVNVSEKSRYNINAITYESWFSDHKPLWCMISVKK